ncbi:MAG TPA: chemotaxis protein CheW [Acetivibrio saccincola]|uniref:chemotaxis protein CheW n=1 Tax=Acetivibrio saccincola TaxID=1677857 RepID=UPI002BF82045|nr:chemotaxis protein CheW [Acetivibrio saccincola]HOA97976.1 chemotaxis protein CheW [Acetivibrio saccincola]HQD27995.1 chemotaxis protein CheW [Acetivibrio saccincola]
MANNQYVVFKLDDNSLAIRIDYVIEIINYHEIFKIPNSPPYIEGLINLRDTIYTILNLREMLNMPKKDLNLSDKDWDEEKPKILLVNINSKLIGLIVDSVDKILILEDEKIVSPSEFDSQFDRSFLEGIAKMENDKPLLLLDPDALVKKVIDKQINCPV